MLILTNPSAPKSQVSRFKSVTPPGLNEQKKAEDTFTGSVPKLENEPVEKPVQEAGLSPIKKAVLATMLTVSAVGGLAGTAGAAPLVTAQQYQQETLRAQASRPMDVVVVPNGTPRIEILSEGDYQPVGMNLGGGVFHDVKGNLAVVPFLAYDMNLEAHDFQRVDLGTKGQKVERFGTTVQFAESSTRRDIYTEHDNRTELQTHSGQFVYERNADGSIHVTGPNRQDFTIRKEGLYTKIEIKGQETVSILKDGAELRVVRGNKLIGAVSQHEDKMDIRSSNGYATVTRSEGGIITEINGSRGMADGRIIRDGDTFLGIKDRDRLSVDDRRMLDEAKARYDNVISQLDAVEPHFAEKHPVVASVLEYASANPRLLTGKNDAGGFLQAGTLLGSTGAAASTVNALAGQAAAISLANSARALGAAALSAKAAAQSAAAAGNLAQAAQLGREAQQFAAQANSAKDQALRTGGKAMQSANLARILAGTAGALEIVNGVMDYKGGKSDKALIEGAVAVTKASMEELTSKLPPGERAEAMRDFDNVMKVMDELNAQADKKVRVGGMKIALGGLMVVSALLGPEAPPILGAIGIAGTAGVTIYEHWGPIKSFLTGSSDKVPTFLDIIPKNDEVVIHLDGAPVKKK